MQQSAYYCLIASLFLVGCAAQKNTADPVEPMNRAVYGANKVLDRALIKPMSQGYSQLPSGLKSGVDNFFNNINEIPTTFNNMMQWKWNRAAKSSSRFLVNTTFGGLGFLDVATHLGLDYEKEDFGQTLATWGYKQSSYLVLPVFGPSTVRDTMGMALDYNMGIGPHLDSEYRYGLATVYGVSTRAKLLSQEKAISAAAIDEYAMVRDAYLQRRTFVISDGVLPADDYPEDGYWEE
jgi:phospholipid-binding lipoprotein MlaA